MDYQEVIDVLMNFDSQVTAKADGAYQTTIGKMACVVAISAMKELQALHDQGMSLERLRDIDFRKEVVERINYDSYMSLMDELEEYKQLGTLDEVRDAVEKQQAKKPKNVGAEGYRYTDTYRCPTCGGNFSGTGIAKYCYHCGQEIDWSEADE